MVDLHRDEAATVNLLTFDLAGRRVALVADAVRQVTRLVAIAPLPEAPPVIEGVINVRGTLVPVLDVRQRFGLDRAPVSLDQHLILAQAGPRVVALRVDRAEDLVAVEDGAVEPVEAVAPGARHVAGLAKLPDGLLVIQDLERFLSLEEGEELDGAVQRIQGGANGIPGAGP